MSQSGDCFDCSREPPSPPPVSPDRMEDMVRCTRYLEGMTTHAKELSSEAVAFLFAYPNVMAGSLAQPRRYLIHEIERSDKASSIIYPRIEQHLEWCLQQNPYPAPCETLYQALETYRILLTGSLSLQHNALTGRSANPFRPGPSTPEWTIFPQQSRFEFHSDLFRCTWIFEAPLGWKTIPESFFFKFL